MKHNSTTKWSLFLAVACISVSLASISHAQQVTVSGQAETVNLNGQINQLDARIDLHDTSISKIKSCGALGQVANSSENCVPVTETDPNVKTHAKNDLPTCGSGQVLKATGPNTFVCVTDGLGFNVTPPTCTGENALQWNGSAWVCYTPASAGSAKVVAHGYVTGTGDGNEKASASAVGALKNSFNVKSVTRTDRGRYTIKLTDKAPGMIPTCTAVNTGSSWPFACMIREVSSDGSQFKVTTGRRTGGSSSYYIDPGFYFSVLGQ